MKPFLKCLVLVFAMLLLPATVWPQQAQGPLMGSEDQADVPSAVSGTVAPDALIPATTMLVIGDDLAGGMGAGMSRMAEAMPNVTVINRFKESSGLARTDVYDWPSSLQKILAANPVTTVVVMLGLNDRQLIRDGNVRLVYKSPEWTKSYQATADRLLDSLAGANVNYLWVGLPPMGQPEFDTDMQYINGLLRERILARGGAFMDIRPYFVDASGLYADSGPDETGAVRKLRARDGIAFMKQGNNRLGQIVLQRALSTESAPQVVVKDPAMADLPTPAPGPAAPEGVAILKGSPSFGQDGLEGETITFQADAILPATPDPVSLAKRAVLAETSMQARSKPVAVAGSMAEKLFRDGESGPVPKGRFDDFAVPPAAQP